MASIILLICGPDGVGKSTQITILSRVLKARANPKLKIKIKYLWVRSPHMMAYTIYKLFRMLGYDKPPLGRFSKKIWIWIEVLSITLKLVELRLRLFFEKIWERQPVITYVLAERYIVDSIVTIITYFIEDTRYIASLPMMFLLYKLFNDVKKKNLIVVFLEAPPKEILNRRLKRFSICDKHLKLPYYRIKWYKYIIVQLALYRVLTKNLKGFVINTYNKRPYEVTKHILKILNDV